MNDPKPCLPTCGVPHTYGITHAYGCPNAEAPKVVEEDYCGCEPGTYCNDHNPAPAPVEQYEAAFRHLEPALGLKQTRRAIGLDEELALVRGALSRALSSVEKAEAQVTGWVRCLAEMSTPKECPFCSLSGDHAAGCPVFEARAILARQKEESHE